jgi:transcription-repair coupling factor (superfamily II helicase)
MRSQTEIELRVPALLPDDYIADVNTRLSLYKRIANSKNNNELNEIQVELIDRFGLLPDATKNLIAVTSIKQRCSKLGIARIEAHALGGAVTFTEHTKVDPMFLVSLLQTQSNTFKLDGPSKLKFTMSLESSAERINWLKQLLDSFKLHLVK